MSDILARIRVKEEHGIRRFLYPLSLVLALPSDVFPSRMHELILHDEDGQEIPLQVTLDSGRLDTPQRLDFAVSLPPGSEKLLSLTLGDGPLIVNDPLDFMHSMAHQGIRLSQQKFVLTVDDIGALRDVIYDGIGHLRGASRVLRNGVALTNDNGQALTGKELLAAWTQREGHPHDGDFSYLRVELTACKSWATVTYKIHDPAPNDEVAFILPLAATAPTLTCDFGIGNGIYGKLQAGTAKEVVWQTQFGQKPHAQWSLTTDGRVDYIGETATAQDFLPQQWFHVIDSDKALAVAITGVPEVCKEMTVRLTIQGDVVITFRLGERVPEAVTFGVCYHFLNDVPAIAAATNPQSILLPPTVEARPA